MLVQRTVKDVVPALETNYSGIKDVLETLVKTYKGKEEEFASFQREHKIVVSTLNAPGGSLVRERGEESGQRKEAGMRPVQADRQMPGRQ